MTITSRTRVAAVALASIGLIGTLAACSSSPSTSGSASGGASSSSGSPSSSSGSGTATKSSTYKDGSYTEQGTYTSPGGVELISVAMTLKSNVVSAVTVKTVKADPTATSYEKMFEAGIGKEITGKNINDLSVTRVAGSSLTSMGFDDALAKIKADAKS